MVCCGFCLAAPCWMENEHAARVEAEFAPIGARSATAGTVTGQGWLAVAAQACSRKP